MAMLPELYRPSSPESERGFDFDLRLLLLRYIFSMLFCESCSYGISGHVRHGCACSLVSERGEEDFSAAEQRKVQACRPRGSHAECA